MIKPFCIAEIGINHNGNLDIANKLILESKISGFDAVKFQKEILKLSIPGNFGNTGKVPG